jgi:hypothetical protein
MSDADEIDYDNPLYAHLKPYVTMREKLLARATAVLALSLNPEATVAVLNAEFGILLDSHGHLPLIAGGTIRPHDLYEAAIRKQQRDREDSPRTKRWRVLSEGYEAGLWRLLSHEINEIIRLSDDPRWVVSTADLMRSLIRTVLIGDKEIPALFLSEYAAASLHVYRNARQGKITQVALYDRERMAIHEAILHYADEPRGGSWEKLLEEELARRCNETLDAEERNREERTVEGDDE